MGGWGAVRSQSPGGSTYERIPGGTGLIRSPSILIPATDHRTVEYCFIIIHKSLNIMIYVWNINDACLVKIHTFITYHSCIIIIISNVDKRVSESIPSQNDRGSTSYHDFMTLAYALWRIKYAFQRIVPSYPPPPSLLVAVLAACSGVVSPARTLPGTTAQDHSGRYVSEVPEAEPSPQS